MRCSKCNHDLLLGVEPEGIGKLIKLLPLTPYSCLRCGANNWRVSDVYDTVPARLGLVAVLAGLVVASVWVYQHLQKAEQHANSVRREITTVTPVPAPEPPVAQPEEQPAPPVEQPAEPQVEPAVEEPAVVTKPTPAPAGEAPLDEVVVEAPDPTGKRPKVMPTNNPEVQKKAPVAMPDTTQVAEPIKPAPAPVEPKVSPSSAQPKVTPAPAQPKPAPVQPVVVAEKAAPKVFAPGTSVLSTIKGSVWNNKTIIKAKISGKIGPRTAFALEKPLRYVVDIPGKWGLAQGKSYVINAGKVTTARAGVYKNKLRLVLDLTGNPAAKPTTRVDNGYLVITIP